MRKNRLVKTAESKHHDKTTEKHIKAKIKLARQRWKESLNQIREIEGKAKKRAKEITTKYKQAVAIAKRKAKKLQTEFEKLQKKYSGIKPRLVQHRVALMQTKPATMKSARKRGRKPKAKELRMAYIAEKQAGLKRGRLIKPAPITAKALHKKTNEVLKDPITKKRLFASSVDKRNPPLPEETIMNNQNIPVHELEKLGEAHVKKAPLQPTPKLKVKANTS